MNTLMVQEVLSSSDWRWSQDEEDRRALTPLLYSHINPYGQLETRWLQRFEETARSSLTDWLDGEVEPSANRSGHASSRSVR